MFIIAFISLLFTPSLSFSQIDSVSFCDLKINTNVGVHCNKDIKHSNQQRLINLYTLNESYSINDVRRYGVFPDENIKIGLHPSSSISKMQALLDLAEAGLILKFPKGFYDTPLLINSRSNINLYFNDSEFSGLIHITNDKGCSSSNIKLKGKISMYDRFGIYHSENIELDTLLCKNDSTKIFLELRAEGVIFMLAPKISALNI